MSHPNDPDDSEIVVAARRVTSAMTPSSSGNAPATTKPRYSTALMTKAQKSSLIDKMVHLKKTKNSPPFLRPVDIVALNIPTYPDIITNPMDLSTMETKLKQGVYGSVQEFVDDFELIINNCRRFLGDIHAVTVSAFNMQAYFNKMMESVPAAYAAPMINKIDKPLPKLQFGRKSANEEGERPTKAVKLSVDPQKLPTPSGMGAHGDAVQVDANNVAALENHHGFDIYEHNIRNGQAKLKQFAKRAQKERDVAQNRAAELRTELDVSKAKAADLHQQLLRRQESVAHCDSALTKLAETNKQLQSAQQANAKLEISNQASVKKGEELTSLLQQARQDATKSQASERELEAKIAELREQLHQAQQDVHEARASDQLSLNTIQEADQRAEDLGKELQEERVSSKKLIKELEEERDTTRRLKGAIKIMANDCLWQTEDKGAPGGKLLDELRELAK